MLHCEIAPGHEQNIWMRCHLYNDNCQSTFLADRNYKPPQPCDQSGVCKQSPCQCHSSNIGDKSFVLHTGWVQPPYSASRMQWILITTFLPGSWISYPAWWCHRPARHPQRPDSMRLWWLCTFPALLYPIFVLWWSFHPPGRKPIVASHALTWFWIYEGLQWGFKMQVVTNFFHCHKQTGSAFLSFRVQAECKRPLQCAVVPWCSLWQTQPQLWT